MAGIRLTDSTLLEWQGGRIVFLTGVHNGVKGFILVLILIFFLLSTASALKGTPQLRMTVLIFAVLAFLLVGRKTMITVDGPRQRVSVNRRFLFFGRPREFALQGGEQVRVEQRRGGQALILSRTDGEQILLALTGDEQVAANWRQAVQDTLPNG